MRKDLLCKDCNSFGGLTISDDIKEKGMPPKCLNPQTAESDLVYGNPIAPYCIVARAKGQPCGPDGDLWEVKE